MIKSLIVLFILANSIFGNSQESLLYQKNEWSYHLTFEDSNSYVLYSEGALVETGYVELEKEKLNMPKIP